MHYSHAVESLGQDMIDKLISAIEIGRWESGEKLTQEQTESAMQAVMLWQAKKQDNRHLGHGNIDNKAGDNNELEPFVIGSQGELFTGKGESHKVRPADKYDENSVIVRHKV